VAEATAGTAGPGPVHLNLAFREPLLGSAADLPGGRPDGSPWHAVHVARAEPPAEVIEWLAGGARRGLLVAGAGSGDPAGVHAMAAALGWPVLADPLSGCRLPLPATVAAADALVRAAPVSGWRPDAVVRLGRPWASRVLSAWLDDPGPDAAQVLVDPFGRWADPERSAGRVVRADPTLLCRAVAEAAGGRPAGGSPAGWAGEWQAVEAAAQQAFDGVLSGHPEVTEPGVARALGAALPDGATLLASSSMPVRDVEWYLRPRGGLRVLANRGANGIDGVVSTALGVALSGSGPTVALLGDLAFLYDAGALLGATGRGLSCTLVVLDNAGGGIFSFLPHARALPAAAFERLWATPHGADLAAIAAAYAIPVEVVGRADELGPAVDGAVAAGGVRMVLARTDRAANVAVHDELNAAVAGAVAGLKP